MRHRLMHVLLFLQPLLFAAVNNGFGQCSTYPAGLSALAVISVTDTGVTFHWTGTGEGQFYSWTITNDPTYNGYTEASGYVYLGNVTADTVVGQGALQPNTTYWIFVHNGICSASDSLSFTTAVDLCPPGAVPVPTIRSTTGNYTVCGGSVLLLQSSAASGNIWYLNGSPLDSTGSSLTVTQGGTYMVVATNKAGCRDTSAVQVVNYDAGPTTPVVTASGPTKICIGSSVTLTSSATTGDQWYDGNTALPGMTGSEYLVGQAGSYWVQVTDQAGCFASSAPTVITVNPDTAGESVVPTINPTGTVVTCTDTSVLLIASQAADYQWFWDGDAIPGENGDSLLVNLSGNYTVATGTAGCGTIGALSAPVVVTYLDQLVPTITMVNGVLVSGDSTGNQWYLNGAVIQGATHRQYTPQSPGSYTVRVETGIQAVDTSTFQIGVGGCWSKYSAPFFVSDSIYIIPQVAVFPNPVVDVLTLVNKLSGPVTVRVFSLTGQQMMQLVGVIGTVQVEVGQWAKGAYFLQVVDQGTQQRMKVVVLKM